MNIPTHRPRRISPEPAALLAGLLWLVGGAPAASAQDLYRLPPGVQTRWASPENPSGAKGVAAQTNEGRKGQPCFALAAGTARVLAEATGTSGIVRRLWLTVNQRDPEMLRGLRIDCFWDGAAKPAISAPLGDFFGFGLGRMAKMESALFASPEGRSFVCFVPMPFRTGMKIVLTNETRRNVEMVFYDVDFTIGDALADDVLYLHAWFHRENPTEYLRDYTILPRIAGRGRFLGANLGVIVNQQEFFTSWWGEGEVKVYLDGDEKYPTLAGTGTEDYVGSAWGLGGFNSAYSGCTYDQNLQYCFFRWHVPDPVFFHSGVRVTWQQLGLWDPKTVPQFRGAGRSYFYITPSQTIDWNNPKLTTYGYMERRDDVSSCAYFYLDRPENDLPPLMPVEERTRGLAKN